MSGDWMVVAEGAGSGDIRPRPMPSRVLTALMLTLALGCGLLITLATRTGAGPGSDSLDNPAAEQPDTVGSIAAGSVISGFHDTLALVMLTDAGTLAQLVWAEGTGLGVEPIIEGDAVTLDISGAMVAVSQTSPTSSGTDLAVGTSDSIVQWMAGVTSHAWHDSRAGWLSYTTEKTGASQLWRMLAGLEPQLVTDLGKGDRVVAWGDWGWAVEPVDGDIELLTSHGQLKATHPGTAYSSHHSGWLVTVGDAPQLLSAGGGVRGINASLESLGPINDAVMSPDGTRVAWVGDLGVVVSTIDAHSVRPDLVFRGISGDWVTWSSDSRFVMTPASRGLYFFDVEEGVRGIAFEDQVIVAAAVRP